MRANRAAAVIMAAVLSVSALTGCGMDKNATVATMDNGSKVSMSLLNFIFHYNQASMDDTYMSVFGDDYWNMDYAGDGTTLMDQVKADIADTIHDLYTYESHMDEMGVSLSEDEKAAIDAAAAQFMADNSSEAIEEMGASKEIVSDMLRLFTIRVKMQQAVLDQADVVVTDEEANKKGYTIVMDSLTAEEGEGDSTETVSAEDQISAIKANFYKMADDVAQGTSLEDAAKACDYETKYDTYALSDTDLDEELAEVLQTLEEGEVSDVISTDEMIYLVRLDKETDEEATASNKEVLETSRREQALTDKLDAWQEGDGWTVDEKVLATLKFDNFLTNAVKAENGTEEETGAQ